MDPLHFAIAMGPLAVYFLLLGMINLSSRPFLTTGARDTAALGVGISGFMIAGPMELFLPEAAATQFGPWVWVLLLAFYGLCLTLIVLLMKPRFVIYNITVDQLRPMLADVVKEIDADARWAGDSLVLPKLGVQLHVEPFSPLRNVQLIASGTNQNFNGWRHLELKLDAALKKANNGRNLYGFFLVTCGLVLCVMVTTWLLSDQAGVAQALGEMLRR